MTIINALAGSDFTVKLGVTDYSAKITDGSITRTPNVLSTSTLRGKARAQTDLNHTVSLNLLYDEDAGLYAALWDASETGADVAIIIIGGDGQWTGTGVKVTSLSASFAAEAHSTCSASFEGDFTFEPVE